MKKSELTGSTLMGNVRGIVRDRKTGEIVQDTGWSENLVVSAGLASVAALIGAVGAEPAYQAIAIGTGQTAPAAGDTALETEITTGGGERRSGGNVTIQLITTVVTNDTCEFDTTFTFTASFAVAESGLFNDASTGDMLARKTFPLLNVDNGKTLQIVWRIQVKPS